MRKLKYLITIIVLITFICTSYILVRQEISDVAVEEFDYEE